MIRPDSVDYSYLWSIPVFYFRYFRNTAPVGIKALRTHSRALGTHHPSPALHADRNEFSYSDLILGTYCKFLTCILKLILKALKTHFNIRHSLFSVLHFIFWQRSLYTHVSGGHSQKWDICQNFLYLLLLQTTIRSTITQNNQTHKYFLPITLDTNYNTNANEITTKLDWNTIQIKSDRKLRFL